MSIGLYDADFSTYILVPFNLEIMKLSAYYNIKKEVVILAPSFTPNRHQKFYYRKDYNDGDFHRGVLTTPNVEYGGLAFSNNKYIPLPMDIERMKPDPTIYARTEKTIMGTGATDRKKIFRNMMEAEHCRLSLDSKTIWPDFTRQFKNLKQARNLMIHDYDLGAVANSFETVQKLMARARTDGWATRVGMKFPVQISDGQSLINWSSLRSNSVFYSLRYNGVIDDEAFDTWIRMAHEKAIYSQMEYHITSPQYEENHFLEILLPKIFHQVIISRSYRAFFSLRYDKGFFSDPMWEEVIKLFNFYSNSMAGISEAGYYRQIEDDTLFDFASMIKEHPEALYGAGAMNVKQVREVFAFVRTKNYELFKEFYECNARKLRRSYD